MPGRAWYSLLVYRELTEGLVRFQLWHSRGRRAQRQAGEISGLLTWKDHGTDRRPAFLTTAQQQARQGLATWTSPCWGNLQGQNLREVSAGWLHGNGEPAVQTPVGPKGGGGAAVQRAAQHQLWFLLPPQLPVLINDTWKYKPHSLFFEITGMGTKWWN